MNAPGGTKYHVRHRNAGSIAFLAIAQARTRPLTKEEPRIPGRPAGQARAFDAPVRQLGGFRWAEMGAPSAGAVEIDAAALLSGATDVSDGITGGCDEKQDEEW